MRHPHRSTRGRTYIETRKLSNSLHDIRLKASMTTSKSNGDRASPYLISLVLPKKSEGIPLIKMENLTVEMQHIMHFLHISKNPQRYNKYIKKLQFT